MSDDIASKESRSRYPLVENRAQAEVMSYVHTQVRPVSRTQLTEALNVSRGKISTEVGRLIEAGLLADEGFANSEAGRRSSLVGIPYSAGLIVAIDIGATSIAVALTTLGGELVAHRGEPADVREVRNRSSIG
jgi:hypothetical protein